MFAIIPIFLNYQPFSWHTSDCRQIISNLFNNIKKCSRILGTIVFTNDSAVKELADFHRVAAYQLDNGPEDMASSVLPAETEHCLNHLNIISEPDFEHTIIINFKNPFITSELIDRAISEYYLQDCRPLMSVSISVDNPCQLEAYFKIAGIGLIHLLNNNGSSSIPDKLRITEPFYYDWSARGVFSPPQGMIFRQEYHNQRVTFNSTPNLLSEHNFLSPLWVYENSYRARYLLDPQNYNWIQEIVDRQQRADRLSGVAFYDDSLSALAFKKDNGYQICFNSELYSDSSYILRLLPVTDDGPADDDAQEYDLNRSNMDIHYQTGTLRLTGIAYYLLKTAEDESYDLSEPFPADHKLWTNSHPKKNLKTGLEIMGRQDFPEVFEPDKTLLITRKDSMADFETMLENGQVIPFPMPEDHSILIESELDLLQYRAAMKGNRYD